MTRATSKLSRDLLGLQTQWRAKVQKTRDLRDEPIPSFSSLDKFRDSCLLFSIVLLMRFMMLLGLWDDRWSLVICTWLLRASQCKLPIYAGMLRTSHSSYSYTASDSVGLSLSLKFHWKFWSYNTLKNLSYCWKFCVKKVHESHSYISLHNWNCRGKVAMMFMKP